MSWVHSSTLYNSPFCYIVRTGLLKLIFHRLGISRCGRNRRSINCHFVGLYFKQVGGSTSTHSSISYSETSTFASRSSFATPWYIAGKSFNWSDNNICSAEGGLLFVFSKWRDIRTAWSGTAEKELFCRLCVGWALGGIAFPRFSPWRQSFVTWYTIRCLATRQHLLNRAVRLYIIPVQNKFLVLVPVQLCTGQRWSFMLNFLLPFSQTVILCKFPRCLINYGFGFPIIVTKQLRP